jgi:hypothetical protein
MIGTHIQKSDELVQVGGVGGRLFIQLCCITNLTGREYVQQLQIAAPWTKRPCC